MNVLETMTQVKQSLDILRSFISAKSHVYMAHSLGTEDLVLAHLIKAYALPIQPFTLDTGRLNPETYDLLDLSENKSTIVFFPKSELVQAVVAEHGINGFYQSQVARKACCAARKIEPLKRALAQAEGWVTGLRRAQSEARQDLHAIEIDGVTGLPKCNPLLEWSDGDIAEYAQVNHLRLNALTDKGYRSIGCAPCTRATSADEHPRAGRWWWEHDQQKECGLHVDEAGKLVRTWRAPNSQATV